MNALTQLESSKPWALVRNCVHSEKCERILVGFSKESLVKVLGFSGSAEAAQGFVYEQPKIFATTRERKCERFVCEQTIENNQVSPCRVTLLCVQKNGALSEQNVRTSIEHSLDALIVALDWNDQACRSASSAPSCL